MLPLFVCLGSFYCKGMRAKEFSVLVIFCTKIRVYTFVNLFLYVVFFDLFVFGVLLRGFVFVLGLSRFVLLVFLFCLTKVFNTSQLIQTQIDRTWLLV